MIRLAEIYYRHIKNFFIYACFTLLIQSIGAIVQVWNNAFEVHMAWLLSLTFLLWIMISIDYEDCK